MLFFFKQFAFQSEYGIYIWMNISMLPEPVSNEQKKMLVSYWTKMFSSTKGASKEEFLFLALDSFIKTIFSDIIKYPVMIALTKRSNN